MLDIDAKEAERRLARLVRRQRRWKRLAVSAVLCTILLALGILSAALWLLTPDGLRALLPHLVNEENSVVTVEAVAIHPQSRILDLPSWGLILYDLRIEPTDPSRTAVSIDQLVLIGPDLPRLWSQQEFHVRRAVIVGLHIMARQQRSVPKRERPVDALQLLSADRAFVWDARYTAPADEPLPAASFSGIYAEVDNLRYDPFDRTVHGDGWLSASELVSGDLRFRQIYMPGARATGSALHLADGSVQWENVRARVSGEITEFDTKAAVHLKVVLHQARIERLVRNATGQASPVLGLADINLDVYSGGKLPRGGGFMDARVHLSEVMIPLPENTRGIYKDVIRLAPIARLDDKDRVILETLKGHLSLTRGQVTLHELVYEARPPVLIRGTIDAESMDLLFRLVLRGDPSTHPGIGLRLHGPPGDPSIARATRDELLPGWREAKQAAREEARAERGGKLRRLFRRRSREDDPDEEDELDD